MRRTLMLALVVTGGSLLLGAPASAGGSWLDPEEDRYEPGEEATVTGYVGRGQLGWIEDGPFYAWLRTKPSVPSDSWPNAGTQAGDIPLGPLRVEPTGATGYRALRVSITFTIPEALPPGTYEVVYCNQGCATGLGDLIGGTVWVGVSRPSASASTATSTSTSVAPTSVAVDVVSRRSEPRSSIPVWQLAIGVGVLLAAGVTAGRRMRRARVGE